MDMYEALKSKGSYIAPRIKLAIDPNASDDQQMSDALSNLGDVPDFSGLQSNGFIPTIALPHDQIPTDDEPVKVDPKNVKNVDMPTTDEFMAHLNKASKMVRQLPEFKQQILGGVAEKPAVVSSLRIEEPAADAKLLYLHTPGVSLPFVFDEVQVDAKRGMIMAMYDRKAHVHGVARPKFVETKEDEFITLSIGDDPTCYKCSYLGIGFTLLNRYDVTIFLFDANPPEKDTEDDSTW